MMGGQVIEPEKWHHVVFRFDAQSKLLLFLDNRVLNYNSQFKTRQGFENVNHQGICELLRVISCSNLKVNLETGSV